MAIDLRFNCSDSKCDFVQTKVCGSMIGVNGVYGDKEFYLMLDIPTAIKFAKTLRTEINKAKEVTNG